MSALASAASGAAARTRLQALLTLLTLGALAGAGFKLGDDEFLKRLVLEHGVAPERALALRSLRNGGPNAEDRAARTAGYYQGLLDGGNAALNTGFLAHRLDLERDHDGIEDAFHARWTGDFLWYDLPPNLDVASRAGHLRTNASGQADQEYSLERAPNTWRVALLGDSLIRGWGTNLGETFEARLEVALNAAHLPEGRERIEIINFGVDGYRLTQVLECARTRATQWQPDVYAVGVGALAGPQLWTPHLAGLVREGRDLKYEPLRALAREAGLDRYDPPATTRAKLAPYHRDVLRFCLAGLRDLAAAEGRPLVVLLTPVVEPPHLLADDFVGVVETLDELGIDYLDLRATFVGQPDLSALRISDSDTHPTGAGHALLFEALYAQLLAAPDKLALWTGP